MVKLLQKGVRFFINHSVHITVIKKAHFVRLCWWQCRPTLHSTYYWCFLVVALQA